MSDLDSSSNRILLGICDTIHDMYNGYRNKDVGDSKGKIREYLLEFIKKKYNNTPPCKGYDMGDFLSKCILDTKGLIKINDIEDTTISYFESLMPDKNIHANLSYSDILKNTQKAQDALIADSIEITYDVVDGKYDDILTAPNMETMYKFIENYLYPSSSSSSSSSSPLYFTFDANKHYIHKMMRTSNTRNVIMPQNIADSASTSLLKLGKDNMYYFPEQPISQSTIQPTKFYSQRNIFSNGYNILYENDNFSATKIYGFKFNIKKGTTECKSVMGTNVTTGQNVTTGPSLDYLLELHLTAMSAKKPVNLTNTIDAGKSQMKINIDTLSKEIIIDIQNNVAAIFLDIKRGGDHDQVDAASIANDSICDNRLTFVSLDRLSILAARIKGLNCILEKSGKGFKIFHNAVTTQEKMANIKKRVEFRKKILDGYSKIGDINPNIRIFMDSIIETVIANSVLKYKEEPYTDGKTLKFRWINKKEGADYMTNIVDYFKNMRMLDIWFRLYKFINVKSPIKQYEIEEPKKVTNNKTHNSNVISYYTQIQIEINKRISQFLQNYTAEGISEEFINSIIGYFTSSTDSSDFRFNQDMSYSFLNYDIELYVKLDFVCININKFILNKDLTINGHPGSNKRMLKNIKDMHINIIQTNITDYNKLLNSIYDSFYTNTTNQNDIKNTIESIEFRLTHSYNFNQDNIFSILNDYVMRIVQKLFESNYDDYIYSILKIYIAGNNNQIIDGLFNIVNYNQLIQLHNLKNNIKISELIYNRIINTIQYAIDILQYGLQHRNNVYIKDAKNVIDVLKFELNKLEPILGENMNTINQKIQVFELKLVPKKRKVPNSESNNSESKRPEEPKKRGGYMIQKLPYSIYETIYTFKEICNEASQFLNNNFNILNDNIIKYNNIYIEVHYLLNYLSNNKNQQYVNYMIDNIISIIHNSDLRVRDELIRLVNVLTDTNTNSLNPILNEMNQNITDYYKDNRDEIVKKLYNNIKDVDIMTNLMLKWEMEINIREPNEEFNPEPFNELFRGDPFTNIIILGILNDIFQDNFPDRSILLKLCNYEINNPVDLNTSNGIQWYISDIQRHIKPYINSIKGHIQPYRQIVNRTRLNMNTRPYTSVGSGKHRTRRKKHYKKHYKKLSCTQKHKSHHRLKRQRLCTRRGHMNRLR